MRASFLPKMRLGIAESKATSYCGPMPRFVLKIEYNGAPFSGWQRQPDQPSVQGAIEAALARLEKVPPLIAVAGRTDAGVHGLAQVAHVDLARDWDPFRLTEAINFHLKPLPVAIIDCARVSDDFHARFWALERRYLFRLISRRAPLTHEAGLAWNVRFDLDLDAMQSGAERLLGTHDFTTFRSTSCQADSPIRTLDELRIEEVPHASGREFQFHVRARSFLHNQIRSFVGTLERVGCGALEPEDVTRILDARDRTQCGPVCPPQGLYFAGVKYPVDPFKAP